MKFWKLTRRDASNDLASRWPDLLEAIQGSTHDLMVVVGPEDGGSVCTEWVGAVVSISGEDRRFPALVDAIEDGLFHPDCRHRLIPYRPEDGEEEALFCTRLAVAGMARRGHHGHTPRTANSNYSGEEPRSEFSHWYGLAREAERTSKPELALLYCQHAITLLAQRDIFGDDQLMIERVLKGRIQNILRAHQRLNGHNGRAE